MSLDTAHATGDLQYGITSTRWLEFDALLLGLDSGAGGPTGFGIKIPCAFWELYALVIAKME